MQQIVDWLKKLSMSEYAERFAENDIDMAVLPDMTDQHLKESLSARCSRTAEFIRALCGRCAFVILASIYARRRGQDAAPVSRKNVELA
jgi:hypothetical protein